MNNVNKAYRDSLDRMRNASDWNEKLAAFTDWQHYRKLSLWSLIYSDDRSSILKFFRPFRTWNAAHIISTENSLTKEGINHLKKELDKSVYIIYENENNDDKANNEVNLLVALINEIALTSKNRSETISEKSDFYPAYSALVSLGSGLLLAAVTILMPASLGWLVVRWLLGLSALIFVATSVYIRMTTRQQSAYLKQLSNILEFTAKEWRRPNRPPQKA